MAIPAKPHLSSGRELSRIQRQLAVSARMLVRSEMTPLALNARHDRLQIARDGGGMATKARLQRTVALIAAQRLVGASLLPDGNPVLMDLAKITHTRFESSVSGSDNRCLALNARSHHPLNQSVFRLAILCDRDLDPILHAPVAEKETVDRIAQRPVRQILRKHATRSRDHGVGHSGLLMQP